MTKLSRKYQDPDKLGNYINNLWSGFILMETKEDIRSLFKDLFTHTEYKMFAKRLEIARRLLQGESYDEITKQINATERTISHISNILAEKGDGFRKVHEKLSAIEQTYRDKEAKRIKKLSRPFNPELPASKVLPELIVAGFKYADKKITQYGKQKSAERNLKI